jgi:hypothetical protein
LESTTSDKINISEQGDAYIGTYLEQASHLRLSVSTLNTTMKDCEDFEGGFVQCGPFSKQLKALQCPPLEELEYALASWCKQACESNAFIDGTHFKEKTLHISACLGKTNFVILQWWNQHI